MPDNLVLYPLGAMVSDECILGNEIECKLVLAHYQAVAKLGVRVRQVIGVRHGRIQAAT